MSFLDNIHKMRLTDPVNLTFTTDNVVKKIYEENSFGDLVPVEFSHEDGRVRLHNSPCGGQLYIKFSKKQK